jgi:hypothetical protein
MQHFKKITYHTAPRYLTSKILERDTPATRQELEVLFQRHVIGGPLHQHCLDYFKANELQRLITLELYRVNVLVMGKDKNTTMLQLTAVTGCHHKTTCSWIKGEFNG